MCLQTKTPVWARLRRSGRLVREDRGVELVEAALVFPLLLALIIGGFWLGRAYNIYESMTRAAREGARFALAPSCATCIPSNAFPSDTEVTTVINDALSAASMDPAKTTDLAGNPSPPAISRNQPLNATAPQVNGVIVSFGYPVKLTIPFTPINAMTITITTQVQMRQEL
jgi:Flp pilus assembly protein TadG